MPYPNKIKRHSVKGGETYIDIAKQYGVSVEQLMKANQGINAPVSGMYLTIPTANYGTFGGSSGRFGGSAAEPISFSNIFSGISDLFNATNENPLAAKGQSGGTRLPQLSNQSPFPSGDPSQREQTTSGGVTTGGLGGGNYLPIQPTTYGGSHPFSGPDVNAEKEYAFTEYMNFATQVMGGTLPSSVSKLTAETYGIDVSKYHLVGDKFVLNGQAGGGEWTDSAGDTWINMGNGQWQNQTTQETVNDTSNMNNPNNPGGWILINGRWVLNNNRRGGGEKKKVNTRRNGTESIVATWSIGV